MRAQVGGAPVWLLIAAVAVLVVVAVVAVVGFVQREPATARGGSSDGVSNLDEAVEAQRAQQLYDSTFHITMPTDRPLSVFFAGDSLGAGFYATTQQQGYRWLVEDHLEQYGAVESAAATKDPNEPLFQIGNAQNIPASGVDLAIIELGTNDASNKDTEQLAQQYTDLIRQVKQSEGVMIVCTGVWGVNGVTQHIDSVISQVCADEGGKYVDLTQLFERGDTYGPEGVPTWAGPSDNFHPNDVGHRLIADAIIAKLTVDG